MTPYIRKKYKKRIKNVTKAAVIQFELKKRGLTQAAIAEDLGITPVAVSRAISDLSTISRVDEWITQNLGLEVSNA